MPDITYTQRGFAIYDTFTDGYGNTIRVQESSNVYGGVWLFCEAGPGITDPAPHLTMENARTLIAALETAIAHQAASDRIWTREEVADA